MKRLINIFHFVAMSSIYAVAVVLFLIYSTRLIMVLFTGHAFIGEDWLIFLAAGIFSVNTLFIIRRKNIMDLYGFPFDGESLP